MKKIALVLLLTVSLPVSIYAADTLHDGYWEIVSTMEMPGMPMKMTPTSIKHCFTKDDVKDQKRTITTDKNCTVTDIKQTGSKVAWKMKCSGKNAGEFSGETVYGTDKYDSTMKMESKGHTMNMKIKAKRIGNCP